MRQRNRSALGRGRQSGPLLLTAARTGETCPLLTGRSFSGRPNQEGWPKLVHSADEPSRSRAPWKSTNDRAKIILRIPTLRPYASLLTPLSKGAVLAPHAPCGLRHRRAHDRRRNAQNTPRQPKPQPQVSSKWRGARSESGVGDSLLGVLFSPLLTPSHSSALPAHTSFPAIQCRRREW
jgi:hypothetical protein